MSVKAEFKKEDFNLYAEISPDGKVESLIFPNRELELPDPPKGKYWFAIRWPVNPHLTGRSMIIEILENQYSQQILEKFCCFCKGTA